MRPNPVAVFVLHVSCTFSFSGNNALPNLESSLFCKRGPQGRKLSKLYAKGLRMWLPL